MPRGTVKWFNTSKGYGFIETEDGGEDVFVHANAVTGLGYGEGLREGEPVEFETRNSPKGVQAVDVRRTSDSKW